MKLKEEALKIAEIQRKEKEEQERILIEQQERELNNESLETFAVKKSVEDIRNRALELKNYYEAKIEEFKNPQQSLVNQIFFSSL